MPFNTNNTTQYVHAKGGRGGTPHVKNMCKYTAYILNGWTHCTKFDVWNLIWCIVSNSVQYYNSDSIKFHTVLNFVPYYNSDTHRCPKFNPVWNLVWAKYNLVRNLIWTKNNPVRNLIQLSYLILLSLFNLVTSFRINLYWENKLDLFTFMVFRKHFISFPH